MAARKRHEGEGRYWGERVIGGIGTAGTARPTEATAAAPCEDKATGSWPGRGTASSPRASDGTRGADVHRARNRRVAAREQNERIRARGIKGLARANCDRAEIEDSELMSRRVRIELSGDRPSRPADGREGPGGVD